MSESALIEPRDLGLGDIPICANKSSDTLNLKTAKEKIEKEILSVAMAQHGGNMTKIAEALGISRPTLYDLLKKHGMDYKP
jgi:two-component system NtrC family response regulator